MGVTRKGFWQRLAHFTGVKAFRSGGWNGVQPNMWASSHPLSQFISSSTPSRERIENDFESYIFHAYKKNGPVFACMQARQMAFAEARFLFRRFDKGRPGDMFSTPELDLLKNPWPGGTTGELLARMEQDASLAGNFFATVADDDGNLGRAARGKKRIVRLRPDWVEILVGSNSGDPNAADARVLHYIYTPRNASILGTGSPVSGTPVLLMPDEVCHFSPTPDPANKFRGMSWLTPIVEEIEADTLAVVHKKSFLENSAVPNLAVTFDKDTGEDAFDEFVESFEGNHKGAWNAYKTLFLMGGADVKPLSMDFQQLEFSQTVGKGESRIAAAAGVPSCWVGFSEGMQGSSLNSGNYAASRRRFADCTIRPLWRMAAASLAVLVDVPAGAELWYDERDIAFLREDATDRAEIMRIELNAVDAGIKAGFEADAVVAAVRDNDIAKILGQHTGLVSVQMQEPKTRDAENDRSQEEAAIRQVEASTVTQLFQAGFDLASIAAYVETGDVSKLKPDEIRQRQAEAAAVQQERSATATPDKPQEDKPPASTTGTPKGG
ncbi:phage portal protein [Streptomyces sp. NPDC057686]|uniref:phage portal protein n=1 Tax=Streptomyces sp. NPDC057686 TaxID=3346212 RepID=UPI0036D09DC5